MKPYRKKLLAEAMLRHDVDFQTKYLLKLYERQTLDEKANEDTHHDNKEGFTIADAPVLTPIAEAIRAGTGLMMKDRTELSKRMPKYATQLLDLIKDEELDS